MFVLCTQYCLFCVFCRLPEAGPIGFQLIVTGPGALRTRHILQFLQVRDRSGLVRDSPYPNFYRSGTAATDWQVRGPGPLGTRHTPVFTSPGPLGTGPGLAVPQFLQVRDRSGLARDSPYPNFYKSGTAWDWPGTCHTRINSHRSGTVQDSPYPSFCRSGTAQDLPGTHRTPIFTGPGPLPGIGHTPIVTSPGPLGTRHTPVFTGPGPLAWHWLGIRSTPIFTGPGPLGICPGLAIPQLPQVRDRLGRARDWPRTRRTPIFTGLGPLGTRRTPVFIGPGPLGTGPGLAVPQFLQVRDRLPRLAFIKLKA